MASAARLHDDDRVGGVVVPRSRHRSELRRTGGDALTDQRVRAAGHRGRCLVGPGHGARELTAPQGVPLKIAPGARTRAPEPIDGPRDARQLKQEIPALVAEYPRIPNPPAPFVGGRTPIRFAGRVYDDREVTNLVDAALDFWLTAGPYANRLEARLAHVLGVSHCSLVNSGSSANLVAFMALTSPQLGARRINRGDEVITVAAGFPTTVAPMVQYGAVPVFVDVRADTSNIDTSLLEAALSTRTKAVMVAHTLGNPF